MPRLNGLQLSKAFAVAMAVIGVSARSEIIVFRPTATPPKVKYRVEKGQSIGAILYSLNISPLWGPKGHVAKTMRRNPGMIRKDGSIIFPGTILDIPISSKSIVANPAPKNPLRRVASVEPAPAQTVESRHPTELESRVGASYLALNAKDVASGATAKLFSDLNYSLALSVKTYWSSRFRSFVDFGLNKLSIDSSQRSVDGGRAFMSGFSIGGIYEWTPALWTTAGAALRQEGFLRSTSVTNLNLDRVFIPQFSLGVDLRLVGIERLSFWTRGFAARSLGMSGVNYDVRAGWVGGAGLAVVEDLESGALVLGLDYRQKNINTALVTQTCSDLGVSFGFRARLGGEKRP